MAIKVFWRRIGLSSLHIEEWEGEYTVFQQDSGKTHFLNQMGIEILAYLDGHSASTDDICRYLLEQYQMEPDTFFDDQVSKTLYRFEELGLTQQVK